MVFKRALVVVTCALSVGLFAAPGASAEFALPGGGVTTDPPAQSTQFAPAGVGDVQIDWSASCQTSRIWSVTSHAFHQDGTSANAVSTALIEEPSARRTHGLVLTMAKELLFETFAVTVTVNCNNVDTVIYTTTVSLLRGAGPCRLVLAPVKLTRTPSKSLLDEIKRVEIGYRGKLKAEHLKPYNDHSKGRHCTIGWGHLIHLGKCTGAASETGKARDAAGYKADYAKGLTQKQAQALFDKDIAAKTKQLRNTIHVDLNQNQYDALFDLFYNCCTSKATTKKLVGLINCREFPDLLKLMSKLVTSGNPPKREPGLAARRQAEIDLFNRPVATGQRLAGADRTANRGRLSLRNGQLPAVRPKRTRPHRLRQGPDLHGRSARSP